MREAYRHCEQLVRAADKDRFIAALYAPADRRSALHALYAFDLEIARVRALARQPLPGELRLQWWREVLSGERAGEARANPVAAALLDALAGAGFAPEPLLDLLEARTFDLYTEPMRTLEELQNYIRRTAGAIVNTAGLLLQRGEGARWRGVADNAGTAVALCDLVRGFPLHSARGQRYLPDDLLQRHGVEPGHIHAARTRPGLVAALAELRVLAREHLAQVEQLIPAVPAERLPALLPAAPAPVYLAVVGRRGYDPFRTATEVPQWRRQWALWRTAMRWSYRTRARITS